METFVVGVHVDIGGGFSGGYVGIVSLFVLSLSRIPFVGVHVVVAVVVVVVIGGGFAGGYVGIVSLWLVLSLSLLPFVGVHVAVAVVVVGGVHVDIGGGFSGGYVGIVSLLVLPLSLIPFPRYALVLHRLVRDLRGKSEKAFQ